MAGKGMSPQMQAAIAAGPPYPSLMASNGGVPTVTEDVAPSVVLMVLYATSAAINMFFFQRLRRRGMLFIPSVLLFGFSMARILTCILRIVWSTRPHDTSTALAAQIFVNAGILIVYIVNVLFAQRILRALQPTIGWHPALRTISKAMYALLGCSLALIIIFIVYGSYTLSQSFHSAQMWVLRALSLYLLIVAATPLVVVPVAFLLPSSEKTESFGEGSMVSHAIVLCAIAALCTLDAGFRAGTSWMPARPIDDPAWYQSKAAFYCFLFVPEILILALAIGFRVDRRFYIPMGSTKRQSYAKDEREGSTAGSDPADAESDLEKRDSSV